MILHCSTEDTPAFQADAAMLPTVAGAYVLLVALPQPVTLRLCGKPAAELPAGRYLYCGSARGPGGIRARVARHLRPDKALRWHIDRLTTAGTALGAWAFPGGCECALVAMLNRLPVPLPGFGSSDCTQCRSHLLSWPEGAPLPWPVPERLTR